ncbi:MAG TPA: glycosyltransferase, partial [Aggregicoccus sp.]|nr:glycosyltransferase [Aggregicoccus sp.]
MNPALVCIPTYNERDNLEPIVRAVLAADPRVDILVVDDNSPDGTGELADRLAAAEPRVRVLHREKKQGLGRAYLHAFRWALAEPYTYVI